MRLLFTIVGGLSAGFVSGLLGVGGGVLLVPIFVYCFKMNMHLAIGTSLAIIVPTSLLGAGRHFLGQAVDLKLALWVSLFSVLGALAGAHISLSFPTDLLRKMFAVFLFLLSIYMFFRR